MWRERGVCDGGKAGVVACYKEKGRSRMIGSKILFWFGAGIWDHEDLLKKWLKEGIVHPILAVHQTSLLPSDSEPMHVAGMVLGCSSTISKGEIWIGAPALLCNHLFA